MGTAKKIPKELNEIQSMNSYAIVTAEKKSVFTDELKQEKGQRYPTSVSRESR